MSGLYSDGSRGGDDPITYGARDNVGIRRAEILDITDPSRPNVAGREDYACDYSRPKPCADQTGDAIAPSPPLPSGVRTLALRVTDTANNVRTTAPRGVLVGGRFNGSNASAGARLRAVFRTGGRTRRTIRPGQQATVSASLRNPAGQGIGNARLQLRTRDLRTGARLVSRGVVETGADGLASFKLSAGPSRSRKGGRYARRYRFTRTFRPRSFRFRARLPREGAYPYSTGRSPQVRVRVG